MVRSDDNHRGIRLAGSGCQPFEGGAIACFGGDPDAAMVPPEGADEVVHL